MRTTLVIALLATSIGCTPGGLGGLDCGSFMPADGATVVLTTRDGSGYDTYRDEVSWQETEATFSIGEEVFTETVLQSLSLGEASFESGGTTTWTQTSLLRCNAEGVWLVGHDYASNTVYPDGTYDVAQTTDYRQPSLVQPLEPALGDTWDRVFDYTIVPEDPEQDPSDVNLTWPAEITAEGSVETPAGGFAALEITTSTGDSSFVHWIGEGVGFAQSDSTEVLSLE